MSIGVDCGSWDVMATGAQSEITWFAYMAARQLADRHSKPVRLFVGSMTDMGACLPQVDARLWLQDLNGVQILDARLADVCSPARNLLQVFDARIPLAYADRFAASRVTRNWYKVSRIGVTPNNASITAANTISNCNTFDVEQGGVPAGAGFLKDRRDHVSMRMKWLADPRARDTTLRLVGLAGGPSTNSDRATIALLHIDNPQAAAAWIEALKTTASPIRLLLGGMSLQCLNGAGVALLPGKALKLGHLSVALMADMPWHLQDEVLWAADFVLTSCESLAMRTMSSGCPLIWCGPQEQSASNIGDSAQHALRRWYVSKADALVKLVGAQASAALKTGGGAALAWRAMIDGADSLQAHAQQIATLVGRAPNVVDVIVASSSTENLSMRTHDFAPTQPGLQQPEEALA